jgi:hypothetical protein
MEEEIKQEEVSLEQVETVSEPAAEVIETPTDNVMTSFQNKDGVVISRKDLSDEEIKVKKLQLEQAKISLEKANLDLAELERQLEMKLPARWLEDDIARLKKDIESKTRDGKELTNADIDYMNSQLIGLEKAKELDIPTRELRLKIQGTRASLNNPEGPARMIKILEKQIRERSENFVSTQQKSPVGVA